MSDDKSTCCCGHEEDEHGHDPDYPGSTACNVPGCRCMAYESDNEENS